MKEGEKEVRRETNKQTRKRTFTFCAKSSTLQGFPTLGIKETLSVGIASQL